MKESMKKFIALVIISVSLWQCQEEDEMTVQMDEYGDCWHAGIYCGADYEYVYDTRCVPGGMRLTVCRPRENTYWICVEDCVSACESYGMTYAWVCGHNGPDGGYSEFEDCWCGWW